MENETKQLGMSRREYILFETMRSLANDDDLKRMLALKNAAITVAKAPKILGEVRLERAHEEKYSTIDYLEVKLEQYGWYAITMITDENGENHGIVEARLHPCAKGYIINNQFGRSEPIGHIFPQLTSQDVMHSVNDRLRDLTRNSKYQLETLKKETESKEKKLLEAITLGAELRGKYKR